MGLRKRPYNEDRKGGKSAPASRRSESNGKAGNRKAPAKKPSAAAGRVSGKTGDRFAAGSGTRASSGRPGYKKTDEKDARRPARAGAAKTAAGNRRGAGIERPVKRKDRNPADESRYTGKPRTTAGGRSYMVRGAKARDIKAKSEEMMDTALPGEIRLNRYIANAGICSRREADDLIAAGLVAVNGKVVTEMGYKVKPGDEVRYNNERLNWEKKVYLIMNKPKDTITTSDDPEGRKIIMELLEDPRLPRVYPVGRLDRNTTGVIILTNDGELAQRLTHPKYNIAKIYKATLNRNFAPKDLQELASNGVELDDGPIRPDAIAVPDSREKNGVLIQIHSGRNRIIHRMFEALGYLVDRLDRLEFAGFEKKGLKRGGWRHLDEKEIKKLKKLVQLK